MELRPPVHQHVLVGMAAPAGTAGDQYEFLIEQVLDGEPGRLPGPVHDGKIEGALEQALDHNGRKRGAGRNGDVGDVVPEPRDPLQKKAVPKRRLCADRKVVAMLAGEANLELRVLPKSYQSQGVLLKLLARSRKRRSVARTLE